jgi:hypothetical protein
MRLVLSRAVAAGVLSIVVVGGLAGCSTSATPIPPIHSSSVVPAAPSGSGGASPGSSIGPSGLPSQTAASSPVATADEAVARVLAQDPRFAGITPKDPDLIGQAAWYTVDPATDGWTVVVRIGWGDCPSGCIDEHLWTYAVGADGTVRLVSEAGPEVPPSPSA